MSLKKIKAQESKGKQKALPKLKTILALPVNERKPSLNSDELEALQNILSDAVQKSGLDGRKYASSKHIHLGLESSLRCINACKTSCVFISLSIKPIHIVSLVARNAEVKDATQPIYVQPNLEDFTEKLFGIRSLSMVLPKALTEISEPLAQWVEQRRKEKVKELTNVTTAEPQIKKRKKQKPNVEKKTTESKPIISIDNDTTQSKSWQGDFISFSEDNANANTVNLKEDGIEALDALDEIMDKISVNTAASKDRALPMEVDVVEKLNPQNVKSDSEDSVDFLGDYKSLVLHTIKPNPNKKPKKKRNKNKKKLGKK